MLRNEKKDSTMNLLLIYLAGGIKGEYKNGTEKEKKSTCETA